MDYGLTFQLASRSAFLVAALFGNQSAVLLVMQPAIELAIQVISIQLFI